MKICPDWPGASLTVATNSGIPDGKHALGLEAVDRADNVGGPTREILIDNTPPASPQDLAVGGGDGWRSASPFEVRWRNPPQEFAPIAGVEYTLCPAPPLVADCVRGTKDASGVESLGGLQLPQQDAAAGRQALKQGKGGRRGQRHRRTIYVSVPRLDDAAASRVTGSRSKLLRSPETFSWACSRLVAGGRTTSRSVRAGRFTTRWHHARRR